MVAPRPEWEWVSPCFSARLRSSMPKWYSYPQMLPTLSSRAYDCCRLLAVPTMRIGEGTEGLQYAEGLLLIPGENLSFQALFQGLTNHVVWVHGVADKPPHFPVTRGIHIELLAQYGFHPRKSVVRTMLHRLAESSGLNFRREVNLRAIREVS